MGKNASKAVINYSISHEQTQNPGYSPIFTHKILGSPYSFPLINKATTLFESFMNTARKYPNNQYIGSRVIYPDGSLGNYQ